MGIITSGMNFSADRERFIWQDVEWLVEEKRYDDAIKLGQAFLRWKRPGSHAKFREYIAELKRDHGYR